MNARYKKQGKAVKWREHRYSIWQRHREFRTWYVEALKELEESYK